MGDCSWSCVRLWHTERNWMSKTNKLKKPYSSSQTVLACLLPLSMLIFLTVYNVIDNLNEDDDHFVQIRDAAPFWRLSAAYYDRMYQDIYFNFDAGRASDADTVYAQNPNIILYQYYISDPDQRFNFQCADIVDENPKVVPIEGTSSYIESLALDSTPFGTLCYHSRFNRNSQNIGGLMLCRNDNINETGIVPIGLFIYNLRQADFEMIQELEWSSMQSIVITLQIWQQFDNNVLGAEWTENEIEVKSIEYNDRKLVRPMSGENGDRCYGLRVVMDRSVYQVYDGKNGVIIFGRYTSLIGAVYSFFILSLGICAKCWDKIIERCFGSLYEKDQKLTLKDDSEEKEKEIQMEQAINMCAGGT